MGSAQRVWRCAALGAIILAACSPPASAATFTATCSGRTGDVASLVSAITLADASAGPNIVELGDGCTYTLSLPNNYWYGPNGLPAISSRVTIDGHGATIARSPYAPGFRFFFVGADKTSLRTDSYASPGPGDLTLENLTLTGGLVRGGDANGGGGGAGMGGAIFNQGTLTIDGSTLTGNGSAGGWAADPTAGPGGGGISTGSSGSSGGGFGGLGVPGALGGTGGSGGGGGGAGFRTTEPGGSATGSKAGAGGSVGTPSGLGGHGGGTSGGVSGDASGGGGAAPGGRGGSFGQGGSGGPSNYSGGGGGGVGGGGGASGPVDGYGGGGGFGGGGGAGLQYAAGDAGFGGGAAVGSPNGAPGFGGAAATTGAAGGGAGMGGAIFNMQGLLTIDNSTLAGNQASGGAPGGQGIGGAVFNLNASLTATDSTFAFNSAHDFASQIFNLGYDSYQRRLAQTMLQDTIVAAGIGAADLGSDKSRAITPQPNRGDATATVSATDIVGRMAMEDDGTISGTPLASDPRLEALAFHGGSTETIALAPGSPAIDKGVNCLGTDQRGVVRPQGRACDIGAYELASPAITAVRVVRAGKTAETLHAEVNPNLQAARVFVRYGKSTAYRSSTRAISISARNTRVAVTITLRKLARGTTYHLQLVATNADGTARSVGKSFKTPRRHRRKHR